MTYNLSFDLSHGLFYAQSYDTSYDLIQLGYSHWDANRLPYLTYLPPSCFFWIWAVLNLMMLLHLLFQKTIVDTTL